MELGSSAELCLRQGLEVGECFSAFPARGPGMSPQSQRLGVSCLYLYRPSGPPHDVFMGFAFRCFTGEPQRPGRTTRLAPKRSLQSPPTFPGRKLRDLLLLCLHQSGETRQRQKGRLRHPLQQQRLEFRADAGLELSLGIRGELALHPEEARKRGFYLCRPSRRRLCQRQPSQTFRKQRGPVEKTESGNAKLIDSFHGELLPVSLLSRAQAYLVKIFALSGGHQCHHQPRDEQDIPVTTLHHLRALAREAFPPETSDKLDRAAFTLLLTFVAVAPFLYGTSPHSVRAAMGGGAVVPAGNMLLELFAFIVAAATFLSRSRVAFLRPIAVPLAAMAAIALLGAVQLIPLPVEILRRVAPVNLQIYHDSGEILTLFGRRSTLEPRISIAPTETVGTVLLVLAYTALFLSTANLLRNRLRRRVFAATLFTTAAVQIFLAAIRESPEDRLHGAFVNPNHFAGYLEIVLALAFGALWAEVLTNSDRAQDVADRAERFEKRFLPLAGRILLWGVVAVGIGLTQSRGGILSAAITTLVLLATAVLHRRVKSRRRALAGAALSVLAGILLVATTAGATRLLRFLESDPRDLGKNTRVVLWRTSLRAWQEFPLLGSGLGTFREAFRRVQPRTLRGLVEQAHSDSLQLLVTGGAVGAALGVLTFASLYVLLFRAWRGQRHREESALVLSGFGALLSLTLHGLVDFNLSIPAIPATLACVLGGAWAAGREK